MVTHQELKSLVQKLREKYAEKKCEWIKLFGNAYGFEKYFMKHIVIA